MALAAWAMRAILDRWKAGPAQMATATTTYDFVLRGGLIVDGRGGEPFVADLAVKDARIADIGVNLAEGREEYDVDGLLITPGFVDIHTHYDGQVTWENTLAPSSNHGVTTVVTGNCGVGFAPCRPADQVALVELMAGVEDIPEVVMAEALSWNWETFSEYLDVVESRPHDIDIAAMLPHSALRVYVMGQRAIDREQATRDDIKEMAELTREAIRAGAVGFGTSRALQHKSTRGESIPTVRAHKDELEGILAAMSAEGSGVFQALSDFELFQDVRGEFAMLRSLVEKTGRPMSFTLNQKHDDPDGWREILGLVEQSSAVGLPIKGQVLCRPSGLLLGHRVTLNPFMACPSYQVIADLPVDERIAELGRRDVRERILAECSAPEYSEPVEQWDKRFFVSDPPSYEPDHSQSLTALAASRNVSPAELAYDALLQDDGRFLIHHFIQNFAEDSLEAVYEMITHPDTVLGLGDGGAHLGLICDASYTTTMLAYWTRDRVCGPRISLPAAVQSLTSSTANAVGLCDRGQLAPGYKADINIIDYTRLRLHAPEVKRDLPAGGKRIVQDADGYVATFLNGVATRRQGRATGAMPGRVVRGAQPAPTATLV
jgi:N-acyl-D-amino-acid deacylase